MSRRAAAPADPTRCATRLKIRGGPPVGFVALAAIGVVLVAGTPPALHAEPDDHSWVGKRVMPRAGGFMLNTTLSTTPECVRARS